MTTDDSRRFAAIRDWRGKERVLEREQIFPLPVEQVFAPFADAGNLQAITPPWLHFRIISEPDAMRPGAIIEYRLRLHGLPVRWQTVIETWDPPYRFTDVQARGPFALWHHTHVFEPVAGGASTSTLARDRVRYRVGFGPFGEIAHALFVGRDVERIFDFRRSAILALVTDTPDERRAPAGDDGADTSRWRVAAIAVTAVIAGAGLVIRQAGTRRRRM